MKLDKNMKCLKQSYTLCVIDLMFFFISLHSFAIGFPLPGSFNGKVKVEDTIQIVLVNYYIYYKPGLRYMHNCTNLHTP